MAGFFCTSCGNESTKWLGRCPFCGAWNTLVESETATGKTPKSEARRETSRAHPISGVEAEEEERFSTGLSEFDRVLGGGAVRGSLILVGGAPGVGKSTLLLQACGMVDESLKVLYATGEESRRQLKMRANRLGIENDNIFVLAETNIETILEDAESYDILVADSVQMLHKPANNSAPGSVSQVRDCTLSLMQLAKSTGLTVFVVGHVNKEGSIAGPKVLEHMVDCVLYFEGEGSIRILRAAKNRFGSTNEIGMFEMAEAGMIEVPNPSELLLSGRPENTPGTCVTCLIEGSRPILAEIQALVTPTSYGTPRRNSNGIDYNRAMLLLAVSEKRGGISAASRDAYINVIGGLEVSEPAADLAVVLAIASSHFDLPVPADLAAIGEVGLTGEVRSVSGLQQRLTEVQRLGFVNCVIPAGIRGAVTAPDGLKLIPVRNIREAIGAVLGRV